MEICSHFEQMEHLPDSFLIHTNCADIKVHFVTDEIIRVRASFDKEFAEESYVLMTTAWEDRLDNLFIKERTRIQPFQPTVEETTEKIVFDTGKAKLVLQKSPLCFQLYDAQGTQLYSDIPDNPYTLDSNHRVNHYSKIGYDDCFYGFGEKPGKFNKAQHYMRLSAKDAMGYDPVDIDSLYKHIPFYIKLMRESGKAVGLFYHNFYECSFNMGREKSNYWPYYSIWQADGGDIDLFFICGEQIADIVDHYTMLTGRPALLPKRALGYQGSSMYYPELEKDSDDAVLSFIDTIKEEGFPIDGFHLSSGYTAKDGRRYVFTWNHTRFKDPRAYFSAMNERGAQNVPNIKPGILLTHPWFEEFQKKDVFIKDSKDASKPGVGKWWGGDGAFWDFTKPEARTAWKQYLTDNVIDIGTDSIWNDNCEYDSLLDKDDICCFDGKGGTVGQLKPIMSNLMCKMTQEAVREHNAKARPYVVCRSGSVGIQQYAQTWCGDNSTSWKSLKYNIATILGMALSGCPNEGSDIGGFYGPAPDEELFVRWVQHGIFQPRFSIHSTNIDNTVTEPWMYQNSTQRIREAILLRYRMMPYLYSAVYQAHCNAAPIMRPLVYEFQKDPHCWEEGTEFLVGRDLLVANVVEPGVKTWKIYLPAGCKWYDFWTYRCYEGGQEIEMPVNMDSIPLFIREGGIIPMAINQLMNMERDQATDLKIIVAPGTQPSHYTLYNDDGVTNDYEQGVFHKTKIVVTPGEKTTVSFAVEGSYPDCVQHMTVEMIAKEKSPYWVTLGDKPLEHFLNRKKFEKTQEGWYYSQSKKAAIIKYPNPKGAYTITVSFEQFDMIGM